MPICNMRQGGQRVSRGMHRDRDEDRFAPQIRPGEQEPGDLVLRARIPGEMMNRREDNAAGDDGPRVADRRPEGELQERPVDQFFDDRCEEAQEQELLESVGRGNAEDRERPVQGDRQADEQGDHRGDADAGPNRQVVPRSPSLERTDPESEAVGVPFAKEQDRHEPDQGDRRRVPLQTYPTPLRGDEDAPKHGQDGDESDDRLTPLRRLCTV